MTRLLRRPNRRRLFLELESLENRLVPATISVNSLAQLQFALGGGPNQPTPDLPASLRANNNDTIEIANGTYSTAASPIVVNSQARSDANNQPLNSVTPTVLVKPSPGAHVVFDGGGANFIMTLFNKVNPGTTLEFTGLTFQNGRSASPGTGGAVSAQNVNLIFNNCVFSGNQAIASIDPTSKEPSGGNVNGGGALMLQGSELAEFNNCLFNANAATVDGGAVEILNGPSATFRSCIFTSNGVAPYRGASGGAIHMASTLLDANGNEHQTRLTIENSRFTGNTATFTGGAIAYTSFYLKAPFTPSGTLEISNSTFENNTAVRGAQAPKEASTPGGALQIEGGVNTHIVLSRFKNNTSEQGGAISMYQANVVIDQSYFENNRAVNTQNQKGGVISAGSESQAADNGDHPKSNLTLRDCFVLGDPNGVNPVADEGGAIYITGDDKRLEGTNGVTPGGTVQSNQAQLTIDHTIFANLVVKKNADPTSFSGAGGVIDAALTKATITNSLFMNNKVLVNAAGDFVYGGAISARSQSDFTISSSSFVNNFSDVVGGAIYSLGTNLNINQATFLQNTIGATPSIFNSLGSAIYSSPESDIKTPTAATGLIQNSVFSQNNGNTIYDVNADPNNKVGNLITYQANQFFVQPGNNVFFNTSQLVPQDAAGLNILIVIGPSGTVVKSPAHNNTQLIAAPNIAQLFTGPNRIHTFTAAGDSETVTPVYVAWVISGAPSGTLSTPTGNTNVTGPVGFIRPTVSGQFHLTAAGQSADASIIHPTLMIAGADHGAGAYVPIFDAANGEKVKTLIAYDPLFIGGARVAMGDVNGDGVNDFIVCAGPGGGPDCRIFDGVTTNQIRQFFVYDPRFIGGTWIATGDVDGDGKDELITGADAGGGPNVQVFKFSNGSSGGSGLIPGDQVLFNFFAFDPRFIGGVRVGAGDIEGIGRADIICAAGPGGGPNITVFNTNVLTSATPTATKSFFVFDPRFIGGVFVTTGDVNGDGQAEIISGPASVGGPNVTVRRFSDVDKPGVFFASFNAFDAGFTDSVRVASGDVLLNGRAAVIAGAGIGKGPKVAVYSIDNSGANSLIDSFFAFDPSFNSGIFVASN